MVAFVVLTASAVGINSQYPALVNDYIVNGDVPQHIYWMQQFLDGELFRDDILTAFAKHMQPYGLIVFYRVATIAVDPIFASKVVPILMYVLSTLYLFRLVKYIGGDLSGLLAAVLFIIIPPFITVMVGGTARTFAYPLVIMFLYYLIRKEYLKASVMVVLQAACYPMVSLVSLLCYLLTFLKGQLYKLSLDVQREKMLCYVCAVLASIVILGAKYHSLHTSSLGRAGVVTRPQMLDKAEFSERGRFQIIPQRSVLQALVFMSTTPFMEFIVASPLYLAIRHAKPVFLNPAAVSLVMFCIMGFVVLFLGNEIKQARLSIPPELIYVVIASAIMYQVADWLLFKLYLPMRYLQFTVPLIVLIAVSLMIVRLTARLSSHQSKIVTVAVIAFLLAHFNILKGTGLSDKTEYKNLYLYLNSLPKSVLIAAPPYIADYIPTFTKKKVFINFELAHPWARSYWEVIKSRPQEFFEAYYSDQIDAVAHFCKKNGIDYLVIDKRHFRYEYLQEGQIYFEPISTEVRRYAKKQKRFALLDIPDANKVFVDGDVFVIRAEVLTGFEGVSSQSTATL
jgi:hypothetical protein